MFGLREPVNLLEPRPGGTRPGREASVARRRMSRWNQVRRNLYLTQRTMGDLSATRRGPRTLSRRLARRRFDRVVWRLLRRTGL